MSAVAPAGARRAGHGVHRGGAAGGVAVGLQVRQAGDVDHRGHGQGVGGAQRAGADPAAPGGPQGELAAGGVPRRHHPVQPQVVGGGQAAQGVDPRRHVRVGPGIAAAGLVDAAVLQVPNRHAAAGEVLGGGVHQVGAGDRLGPAAAMDQHHHRIGPGPGGQPQLAPLVGAGTVGDARRRGGPRPGAELRPAHRVEGGGRRPGQGRARRQRQGCGPEPKPEAAHGPGHARTHPAASGRRCARSACRRTTARWRTGTGRASPPRRPACAPPAWAPPPRRGRPTRRAPPARWWPSPRRRR